MDRDRPEVDSNWTQLDEQVVHFECSNRTHGALGPFLELSTCVQFELESVQLLSCSARQRC